MQKKALAINSKTRRMSAAIDESEQASWTEFHSSDTFLFMRYWIMIIITTLIVSGVANAAMLCCLEKNEATDTIATTAPNDAEMPCHQATNDNSDDQTQDAHSDQHCECQYCMQNAALTNTTQLMSASSSTSLPLNGDTLTILVPRSIYHPPKPSV